MIQNSVQEEPEINLNGFVNFQEELTCRSLYNHCFQNCNLIHNVLVYGPH